MGEASGQKNSKSEQNQLKEKLKLNS